MLGPGDAADLRPAVALAQRAAAKEHNANNLNTLGAVLYRAGQFEEAVAVCGKLGRLIDTIAPTKPWWVSGAAALIAVALWSMTQHFWQAPKPSLKIQSPSVIQPPIEFNTVFYRGLTRLGHIHGFFPQ